MAAKESGEDERSLDEAEQPKSSSLCLALAAFFLLWRARKKVETQLVRP